MTRPTRLPPFVTQRWVREHRDHVVLVDVRWFLDPGRSGHEAYLVGHIPGAVFLDLDHDLAAPPDTPTEGRHPLPSPDDFAAALGAAGIGDDDAVVAYDQGSGAIASRLVWMLRVLHRPAAVLDGGLRAWQGSLRTGEETRPPARSTPRPWPEQATVTTEEVADRLGRTGTLLVDARDPERYRGEIEPIDPRPGHVPGAVNLPFRDNVDRRTGRLLDGEMLRSRFAAVGADGADDVIVYCGSGVTACHDILAMESVGIPARLYPASWSGWSSDDARPAERSGTTAGDG